jgi:penicillin-binding protein 1A
LKKKKQPSRTKKILIRVISLAISLGLGVPFVFFLLVYNGFFATLPDQAVINNIDNIEASMVYDVHGKILGKYYLQDRTEVSLQKINPFLIEALIATEDKRFYQHSGIDARSLLRVLIKSLILRSSAGGGSTITIQLAKNLFPRQQYGIFYYPVNKTKEAIIAYRIEKQYSKDEILALYLNTVSFGEDVYGVESAAQRFFGKSALEISDEQAATLVGMLKATTSYNPVKHPEAALERRNIVLSQMVANESLTRQLFEVLQAKPLLTDYQPRTADAAEYFLANLRTRLEAFIADYNKHNKAHLNLLTDGLKVYTTIDANLQEYAEQAMATHMQQLQQQFDKDVKQTDFWLKHKDLLDREIKKVANGRPPVSMQQRREMFVYTAQGETTRTLSPIDSLKHYLQQLQAGFLALDPSDGAVRVWSGGIDYQFFPYDHVKESSKRQVGSTFKPFVYSAALENGISPCNYFSAEQVGYEVREGEWKPANDNAKYEGKYTMEGALEESVNTVSVKILDEVGVEKVIDYTHNLGISSYLPNVPSLALGTASISLSEMVTAYAPFVNGGYRISPYTIVRIENSEGELLYERQPSSRARVMSEKTGRMITHLLQAVVDDGTARSIRSDYGLKNAIGGKTGTTQNNADGWFMTVTPKLVTGAWVGGTYPEIAFSSTRQGQGATMALPIFARFYRQVNDDRDYDRITRASFPFLKAEWQTELDCDPFKEDFKLLDWLFKRDEDNQIEKREQEEKKPGLFKRLFKKKPKKDES